MLIAIAAAAAVASTLPTLTDEQPQTKVEQPAAVRVEAKLIADRTNRCTARVMEASTPGVRYDRGAADPGALDRQPDRGEAQLFSTVELKVEGCSLPVLRARAGDMPPVTLEAVPLGH
jgi:hypothetical protein